MTHGEQIMLWGALIVGVVAVNFFNRKDPDALGLSLIILLIWCASRVLALTFTPPENLQFAAVMDLMAAGAAVWACSTRRAFWKLALASCYGVQLCAHAVFWTTRPSGDGYIVYLTVLNATLVLQLVCVGGTGILNVASSLGARLFGPLRGPHLSRH